MLKKILIALVVVVASVLGLGFVLPSEQRVARSVTVNAPPETLYAYVANLQKWETWSPWSPTKVPGVRYRYDGPETGVGARMVWEGETIGDGKLWLTQADSARGIGYELSVDGDQHKSSATLQFVPTGPATLVVWTWKVRRDDPIDRLVGIVAGENVGHQFEVGLVELKKVAEAAAPPPPPEPTPVVVETNEVPAGEPMAGNAEGAPDVAPKSPVGPSEVRAAVESEGGPAAIAHGAGNSEPASEPVAEPSQP